MNLVLLGLPGTGKSTVGRMLAEQLGRTFADTDEIITQRFAAPTEIFATRGEEGFRLLEEEVARELSARDGLVIATGGGLVTHAPSRDAIRSNGTLIWLKASVSEIERRLGGDTTRPLLAGNFRERLEALESARTEIYRACADFTVDTDGLTPEEVSDIIMREAEL